MWKLIFSEQTNIGTGCNREPGVGEFSRDLAPAQCAWFNATPERYMWNGYTIVEVPNVTELLLKEAVDKAVNENKAACGQAILKRYDAATQRNAALGLYGEDKKLEVVDFIARCIAIEDTMTDELSACVSIEQLESYQYTPYPVE